MRWYRFKRAHNLQINNLNPAKQQTIKRLLSYAGKSSSLLSLSLVLSGLSALVGFVPYIMVFFVIRDMISSFAANEAVHAAALARYGLWAVGRLQQALCSIMRRLCFRTRPRLRFRKTFRFGWRNPTPSCSNAKVFTPACGTIFKKASSGKFNN